VKIYREMNQEVNKRNKWYVNKGKENTLK